eukprot:1803442-Rhodomonas_salina.1
MAVTNSKDNILSHALLKKQEYEIELCEGRQGNPTYCGKIVTPSGDVVTLVFEDNMYRLQWLDESVTATEPKKSRLVETAEHPILTDPMVLPSLLSDEQCMQVEHDRWGHPSESTARKNYKHCQGKSFPRDFLQLLPKTSCLVCPLAKGARPYKHTTRFLRRWACSGCPRIVEGQHRCSTLRS